MIIALLPVRLLFHPHVSPAESLGNFHFNKNNLGELEETGESVLYP